MVVGGNLQPALHYCPQRRRQLMRTVYELDYILRNAELIHPGEVDGIIHLGSTVVVQEEGAELETYTLVGPAEANPCEGCISNRSPLGRALLGPYSEYGRKCARFVGQIHHTWQYC